MYLFSLFLIRKTVTWVFFDDVISIVMISPEVIKSEKLFVSYSFYCFKHFI